MHSQTEHNAVQAYYCPDHATPTVYKLSEVVARQTALAIGSPDPECPVFLGWEQILIREILIDGHVQEIACNIASWGKRS